MLSSLKAHRACHGARLKSSTHLLSQGSLSHRFPLAVGSSDESSSIRTTATAAASPTDVLTKRQQVSLPQINPIIQLAQPTLQLVSSLVSAIMLIVSRIRDAFFNVFPMADLNAEDVRKQIKELSSQARLAAFIAPFAKAASSESLTNVYTRTFERAAFGFAKMYLFCLFMRVLLSWFPSIDWNAQPWTFLRLITEPYLQIYRGLLPPVFGGLDFTPLIGFMILQDVVEVMAPTYTMGMHAADTSTKWTTSDVMCYFDGF